MRTAGLRTQAALLSSSFSFLFWTRKKKFYFLPKMIFEKHKEYLYLRLVEDIISNGASKDDSTRNGTLSKIGCQMNGSEREDRIPLIPSQNI